MFEKKEKRFNVKEAESYSGSGTIRIIVDTKTGVIISELKVRK